MKDTLHIFTDGGYTKNADRSYYGFIMYKESKNNLDILTVKTKKVKGSVPFERLALMLAYDYLVSSNIVEKLNVKVIVHTEMFEQVEKSGTPYNRVKINFEKFLTKKTVSFVYSPAHKWDLFNLIIDTLISDNNLRRLVCQFDTSSVPVMIKSNIEMNTKGYINMYLLIYKMKLENLLADGNVKKENFEVARSAYFEFFMDKSITYKGKRLLL